MRYVVLGTRNAIDSWRRHQGLPVRDVVACTTRYGRQAVRGLSGPFEVVTLPSWAAASDRVRGDVANNLAIAGLTARPDGG